jgi:putative flippase GtrA
MKKIKELYLKYKEIINYLIVGVLTTVVSLAVYYFSVFTFLNPENSIELQIANIISWIAGVAFAYFTNRKYVFESEEQNKLKEASKFVLARVVTLIMDMVIMYLGVTLFKFNDKIVKLVSQVIIIVSNYVFSKLFVFKSKKGEK